MSKEDDRGYFRVATRIGFTVSGLADDEWDAAVETFGENEPLSGRIEPELARVLDRLEQKIDLVLEKLGAPNPQRIEHPEPQEVLLSGSGVRLEGASGFERGDRVLVELRLTPAPSDRIAILGSVVVADAPGLAIRFDVIREEDRDRIVQHTLSVERRRLRHKRPGAA